MKHSRVGGLQSTILILTVVAVILLPLLLALAWGRHFSPADYTLLHFAREMANEGGVSIDSAGSFSAAQVNSLLFALLVSIPARMWVEPAWTALILSAIGWSFASSAVLAIGQSLKRFRGAIITALLLSFSPVIITTLGSPASWIIALGLLTVALLLRRHVVFAILTFFLLTILLLPWPPGGGWSHHNHYFTALAWSTLLFAAGVGVDWLAAEMASRDLVRLPYPQIASLLLAIVFVLFGAGQIAGLWQLFQSRPEMIWQLEEDVAAWLQSETEDTAKLLASERIGYLARRSSINAPDIPQLETAAAMQNLLQTQPADYLVTSNELRWQQLQELTWFRLAFKPVKHFDNSYLPQAPFTIWAYREPIAELGARQMINARVPDRLSLLGYQIGPQQVQAGDTAKMALYFQAPDATAIDPVLFQVIVRLISPIDNSTVREWSFELPQEISPSAWQAKDVIIEQFDLDMPRHLEPGAYQFNISLVGADESEWWPISLDNDINRLDRVAVGGLIVPLPTEPENYQPLETIFADQISLSGYSIHEQAPGKPLQVDLFWEALQQIDEDYTVFTHLLSADGQLIASHDNQPDNGRFPTSLWLPGVKIPDRHTIQLPDDLPAGDYELRVGLYQAETGERLIISTGVDERQEASSELLSRLSIP